MSGSTQNYCGVILRTEEILRQVVAQTGEDKNSKKSLNHGEVVCLKEWMGAPK